MRRYLRVLLACAVFALLSALYVFSQFASSLERAAGRTDWRARRGDVRQGAGKGAQKSGPSDRHWFNRCRSLSVSYWNPYWRLPPAVCGMNCLMESSFRYILRDEKPSQAGGPGQEPVHLAVVACGQRLDETLTMLKSAVALGRQPLCFHIFAEDELHSGFRAALEAWPAPGRSRYNYTLYPITFPADNAAEWKKLFKPCASQRLFLPIILKDVDSLLYVDTDILFLRPVEDLWSLLARFNSSQLAAMAPEHEEPRIAWYSRFARHPYYGKTGLNSGVMLMNMTRIREKHFKNDMTSVALRWNDLLIPLLQKYKLNITWGDQDLLNIIFHHNPESLFLVPCQWNYRPDHCIYGSNCIPAEQEGVFILHGNRGVYHDEKQPSFRAVYQAFQRYTFGEDLVESLLLPLEEDLRKTTHTYCGRAGHLFTKRLQLSVRTSQGDPSRGQ
ncbi:glucoside xylosyltransferase 1-like isoform X1 [Brienomyrus brachyistius]|uniref:glucoside xylosyltransferase 1-like isoform X1 n=1 Tax=Brienomyrus brachyistius TaxID=42636 RepID=UPI0020B26851|nr:glucoside xylosyltransferase 1-like isoform X1 [Brienomyrus brachyistius]